MVSQKIQLLTLSAARGPGVSQAVGPSGWRVVTAEELEYAMARH